MCRYGNEECIQKARDYYDDWLQDQDNNLSVLF